jgi:threonyl-tRNA synthetase
MPLSVKGPHMKEIGVALPDGSNKSLEEGATVLDLARAIGAGLARNAIAGKVNGEQVDLSTILHDGEKVEIITEKSPEALEIIRHSTSHLMAQAVKSLFPEAKVTIGPSIENGFYYDFDVESPFSPDDLEKIEAKMRELAKAGLPVAREVLSKEDAIRLFKEMGENYKVELIEDLDADTVSLYRQGDFVDLCRGPHLPSTSFCKAFKLTSIAGA